MMQPRPKSLYPVRLRPILSPFPLQKTPGPIGPQRTCMTPAPHRTITRVPGISGHTQHSTLGSSASAAALHDVPLGEAAWHQRHASPVAHRRRGSWSFRVAQSTIFLHTRFHAARLREPRACTPFFFFLLEHPSPLLPSPKPREVSSPQAHPDLAGSSHGTRDWSVSLSHIWFVVVSSRCRAAGCAWMWFSRTKKVRWLPGTANPV